jgi:hypothetical protein
MHLLLPVLCGIALGLILSVLSSWRRFHLRNLLILIALVSFLMGAFRMMIHEARYAAIQSSFGGRRFTRDEAEAVRGEKLRMLPDSEFLPAPAHRP